MSWQPQRRNTFISHIHEDDEGLGKLKSLLKDNGMTVRDYSINADNPNNAIQKATSSPRYLRRALDNQARWLSISLPKLKIVVGRLGN